MAGRRSHTRTLSVWSNGQRVGLCSAGWLMRLPQEDFSQALGVAPHLKYEAGGGPGVRSTAPVFRNSLNSAEDLRTLVATQILFGMLAAPDGHAKNFSLQLLAGGRYRLDLLYDVMSIWPIQDRGSGQWSWHKAKMAMPGKNSHHPMKNIERRHFNALGVLCGLGKDAESRYPPDHWPQRTRDPGGVGAPTAALRPAGGRHGAPGPAKRCCPAPSDALHMMTPRLAIHRCQCLHWRLRAVLHLGPPRR